jgi:hypothetical protein
MTKSREVAKAQKAPPLRRAIRDGWRTYLRFFWPLNAFVLCQVILGLAYREMPKLEGLELSALAFHLAGLAISAPINTAALVAFWRATEGKSPHSQPLLCWDLRALKIFGLSLIFLLPEILITFPHYTHATAPTAQTVQHHHELGTFGRIMFWVFTGELLTTLFWALSILGCWYGLAQIAIARKNSVRFTALRRIVAARTSDYFLVAVLYFLPMFLVFGVAMMLGERKVTHQDAFAAAYQIYIAYPILVFMALTKTTETDLRRA